VLLSRTPTAKDTIFVGDPDSVVASLLHTMKRTTQYTHYICSLLDAFVNKGSNQDMAPVPVQFDLALHPYRPIDVALPVDNTGCSYLLVSCKNTSVTYIGETHDLSHRIDCHNSGIGSDQTQSVALRPWAVLAFVVGFDGDRNKRKAFESQWKAAREHEMARLHRALEADEVANLALQVITKAVGA